jgi:uncharacterized small protein (DUF1192 family)
MNGDSTPLQLSYFSEEDEYAAYRRNSTDPENIISGLEVDVAFLTKEQIALENTLRDLREEKKCSNNMINFLKIENVKLDKKNEELISENKELIREKNQSNWNQKQTIKQLQLETNQRAEQLQKELADLQAECNTIQNSMMQANNNLRHNHWIIAEQKEYITALQNEIDNLKTHMVRSLPKLLGKSLLGLLNKISSKLFSALKFITMTGFKVFKFIVIYAFKFCATLLGTLTSLLGDAYNFFFPSMPQYYSQRRTNSPLPKEKYYGYRALSKEREGDFD